MSINRFLPTVVSLALRWTLLLAVALPLGAISSFEALFAPRAELWERWTAHHLIPPRVSITARGTDF